jgi:hypothetical protein
VIREKGGVALGENQKPPDPLLPLGRTRAVVVSYARSAV